MNPLAKKWLDGLFRWSSDVSKSESGAKALSIGF